MVRKFGIAAVALLAVLFTVAGSTRAADEKKKDEHASLEDIMEKVPGKKGLVMGTVADGKADKWDAAQKKSAEAAKLAADLGKNSPPKGSKESWAKLSKAFAENMSELDKSAKAKDLPGVEKAAKAFGESCKKCHDEHQKND